jgi:hypothetical protein
MQWHWPPLFWERHHKHKHHHFHVILVVAGVGVYLEPGEVTHIMATPVVGQTVPLSIAFLDQHGAVMTTTPTPDAPPAWSNTTPAVETLASATGLTNSALAVAPGADTINLSLAVGGVTFQAALADTVVAAPQVLTSIAIVAGTPA